MTNEIKTEYPEPTDEEMDDAFGDFIGRDITPENALVVIARELRFIRSNIERIEDAVRTTECSHQSSRGIADVLQSITSAIEEAPDAKIFALPIKRDRR